MPNKTIAASFFLAAIAAVPAHAETGARADVHVGWDHPSISGTYTDGTQTLSESAGKDGFLYGVELGYDLRIEHFSLGVYGGYDGATTRTCVLYEGSGSACLKSGRNWTAGARVGLAVSEGALVYLKGGYSSGSFKLGYSDLVDPANDFAGSENMDGVHFGGGVQVDLGDRVYARLEYVRTNYKDYAFSDGAAGLRGGFDRDAVTYGVGLRF